MTQTISPLLVGRHFDRITKETENWTNLIFSLNDLIPKWNQYFNEEIDLPELHKILNVQDLEFYIKNKATLKNPEHAGFLKTMNLKIEKMLELIQFPNFNHLIDAVFIVNMTMKQVPEVELERWYSKLFDSKFQCFEFKPELESEIQEKHSVYANTDREKAAFLYMCRLADTINVLNDCGLAFKTEDYPRFIFSQLDSLPTEKLHAELKMHRSENRYPISHFRPNLYILEKESQILTSMSELSDIEISELITNLQK